jgi:ATP-dependent RNA helicase DeaD
LDTTTFAGLGCAEPFLAALELRGFHTPTAVQAECFEAGVQGRDLLVQSRTGSGKTLAFGLPLMHRLSDERHPQAIILTPTRELAQQVAAELRSVSARLPIALLVGGTSYEPQLSALRNGSPVIVGTPGRVLDHLDRGTLDLATVTMVVLDECDEMLNMGFIEDVEKILARAHDAFQTYLFSATLPAPIASLARRFLKDPHKVQLGESGGVTSHADIAHTPCLVDEHQHTRALVNFLLLDEPASALIFSKRRQEAEEIAEALREAGLAAEYLHGDLVQGVRTRIMNAFKDGKLRYLVATDVAARGIDVENMPLVVHVGIPMLLENYIHRSGRTGRAGAKGTSLALVGFKESRILTAWARRGGLALDWRPVPTRDEIRQARMRRLAARVGTPEAPPRMIGLARKLLAEREPEAIVAILLSMIESEAHDGFDIPEPPRGGYGDDRRFYGPRSEGKPAWKSRSYSDQKPAPRADTRDGGRGRFKRANPKPGR